ncbi:MAG: DUF1353 domain-containing protein [Pseudomonadota bacterium]
MTALARFSTFDRFELMDDQVYQLTMTLVWDVGKKRSGWIVRGQPGEQFDLSVPWWLTWLQSRHDRKMLPAAWLHDRLLKDGFDRTFAAGEFRRACRARGVSAQRAWCAWLGVLIWTAFK